MAKTSGKTGGTSRIKFIMFDAEIADDQIQSVTQAITSALRGSTSPTRRLGAPPPQLNGGNGAAEHVDEPEVVEDAEELDTFDVTPAAPKKKSMRRVAPKPQVVNDLDTTSEPALSSLVDPKSNHRRYLMVAAWLHDHRQLPVITADHIYTCYRHLGWPTDILDFAQPLRELKHKQYFTTPDRGKYAINQLGLQKAKEAE
jgi:hypothetical protein